MILLSENSVYLIRNACLCSFTISDCHDPVEPTILFGAGLEIRGRAEILFRWINGLTLQNALQVAELGAAHTVLGQSQIDPRRDKGHHLGKALGESLEA